MTTSLTLDDDWEGDAIGKAAGLESTPLAAIGNRPCRPFAADAKRGELRAHPELIGKTPSLRLLRSNLSIESASAAH
jgi:hypothetical protein